MLILYLYCVCFGLPQHPLCRKHSLGKGLKNSLKFLILLSTEDTPNTLPTLSILIPVEGKGSDICLAAGFFPKDKTMILNEDNANVLDTSNAALSDSKTYYYAGFNKGSITKCKMDGKEATKTEIAPDSPVTGLYLSQFYFGLKY